MMIVEDVEIFPQLLRRNGLRCATETGSVQFLPFNGNVYYGILVFNLMLFWTFEHERDAAVIFGNVHDIHSRRIFFYAAKIDLALFGFKLDWNFYVIDGNLWSFCSNIWQSIQWIYRFMVREVGFFDDFWIFVEDWRIVWIKT